MMNFYKITELAKQILFENVLNKKISIDFTLGHGNDSTFLSSCFELVYAFDVQEQCIENFRSRGIKNVNLILDTHTNVDKYVESFDCGMYNLGYLPKGDKTITTLKDSTVLSLSKSIKMLSVGGFISIVLYTGHRNGYIESLGVLDFCSKLCNKEFNVAHLNLINKKFPPSLILINRIR